MRYRVASSDVVGKVLDDEAVVINLTTGIYYGLDGPAAKIWECASAGVPVERIASALGQYYPDQPQAGEELTRLLDQMREAGLLIADEGDAPGPDAASDISWPSRYQPLEMSSYDDVAEMVALDPPLPELSYEMIDQPGKQAL